ncbi:uncharacterized protein LOC134528070 isoform X2 [Bacillus rossius redtenbacheri]|uniref:uncharacterized protein LOC134528070 isoform X2 n=1 Tax=Bacillus rossius redtenbacheri TaxID=93214 RepID=UPI002FDD3926
MSGSQVEVTGPNGAAGAVRCRESRCEPSEEQYCRLDDGLDHLADCHYANYLETLRHLQEYQPSRSAAAEEPQSQGPVVTADRMWCATVVGVAEHPSGATHATYRACVPRDGERCRELMQLATERMRVHALGGHQAKVRVNCTRCSTDACNTAAGPHNMAASLLPLLLLPLLAACHPQFAVMDQ